MSARSTMASTSTENGFPFRKVLTPGAVPWSSKDVDVVLECSGRFRTKETLEEYFAAGVKTVIVAAPVKTGALNIVVGVNDHLYDPKVHRLLTAASCTNESVSRLLSRCCTRRSASSTA